MDCEPLRAWVKDWRATCSFLRTTRRNVAGSVVKTERMNETLRAGSVYYSGRF